MKILVKILVLPGINKKTFEKDIDVDEGGTFQELFEAIKGHYEIDLHMAKNCLFILDGEALSIERPWEISLKNSRQLLVMPMISGG